MKKLLVVCLLASMSSVLPANALAAAEAVPEPPTIRVAYNYCALSYTFAYYTDADWDAEIDRLAKAGKKLTIAIRPVSSLGTKGKAIGVVWKA